MVFRAQLDDIVLKDQLFVIDKIRSGPTLDARACTLRDFDCWRIYLNPSMLDREREEAECHSMIEVMSQKEQNMTEGQQKP